jgi:hypothetical protein
MMHPSSDTELHEYIEAVVACLMKYGGLNEPDAREVIEKYPIIFIPQTETDRLLLFHEEPYYWAMSTIYGKSNPQWYNDAKLWPPPHPNEYWPPKRK